MNKKDKIIHILGLRLIEPHQGRAFLRKNGAMIKRDGQLLDNTRDAVAEHGAEAEDTLHEPKDFELRDYEEKNIQVNSLFQYF